MERCSWDLCVVELISGGSDSSPAVQWKLFKPETRCREMRVTDVHMVTEDVLGRTSAGRSEVKHERRMKERARERDRQDEVPASCGMVEKLCST